ncbi:MAG: hypothetical protein OHK0039_46110 [Bacteroidia bacterium]
MWYSDRAGRLGDMQTGPAGPTSDRGCCCRTAPTVPGRVRGIFSTQRSDRTVCQKWPDFWLRDTAQQRLAKQHRRETGGCPGNVPADSPM